MKVPLGSANVIKNIDYFLDRGLQKYCAAYGYTVMDTTQVLTGTSVFYLIQTEKQHKEYVYALSQVKLNQ